MQIHHKTRQFFNGFKDSEYTLNKCTLNEKMVFYFFVSKKKVKEDHWKFISKEPAFPVYILTRSSQYGLFVNYMLILTSPAKSVSGRFSIREKLFKRRKSRRGIYNYTRKARTKICTYSEQNNRINNMFYVIQSQKHEVYIFEIHVSRYAARELEK